MGVRENLLRPLEYITSAGDTQSPLTYDKLLYF